MWLSTGWHCGQNIVLNWVQILHTLTLMNVMFKVIQFSHKIKIKMKEKKKIKKKWFSIQITEKFIDFDVV